MNADIIGALLPSGIGCGVGKSWLLTISRAVDFSLCGTGDSLLLVTILVVKVGSPSLGNMPLKDIFALIASGCQRGKGRPIMFFICRNKQKKRNIVLNGSLWFPQPNNYMKAHFRKIKRARERETVYN